MNKVSFRIKARDLPPEQAARLETPLRPDDEVEVTIEEVDDFSDVPRDILDSQIEGLRDRLQTEDWATDEEVEAAFRRMLGSRAK